VKPGIVNEGQPLKYSTNQLGYWHHGIRRTDEDLLVDGGRHQYDLSISSDRQTSAAQCAHFNRLVPLQEVSQQANQEIRVHTSLVRFVHHDMADPFKIGIPTAHPSQQHTSGAKHQTRIFAPSLFASDSVSDRSSIIDVLHTFLSYARSDTHSCNSARLRD
jgi:hypothetical protein